MAKSRAQMLRDKINKKAGTTLAYNLNEENPVDVKDWISTGSRVLDSILAYNTRGGIPVGRVSELAGVSSTGKSYLAAQIAINAYKKNMDIIIFDSESSIDKNFIERMGVPIDDLIYIQAISVEFVLQTIEDMLKVDENPKLFIWDTVDMTSCEADIESDFNPLSSIALKPRILNKGLKKLIIPLANHNSTLLIVNQLHVNIQSNPNLARVEPFKASGGNALRKAYSLAIWLKESKSQGSFLKDKDGRVIGTEVKAWVQKSRFGDYRRECSFKILWGGEDVCIQDELSWFDAIKGKTDSLTNAGAWYTLKYGDGTEERFQPGSWMKKIKEPKFKKRIEELLDEVLILKFANKMNGDKNASIQEENINTPKIEKGSDEE